MNRRDFPIALAASCASIAIGCESEPQPAMFTNARAVNAAMLSMDESIGGLEMAAGAFQDENWREVVPDVQVKVSDVRIRYRELRKSLGYPDA